MKIEQIVTDLNGHELLLRSPEESDAAILIEYMKKTAEETPFLRYEVGEFQFSEEQEKAYIRSCNDNPSYCMIMAFYDGEYAGNCSVEGGATKRTKHRGTAGIALYEKFTEKRIGTTMFKKLIAVAKEMGFEQLELEVAEDNERARNLYQRMGFSIFGVFPKAQKYKDGTYRDYYWMMKSLKEE